MWINQNCFLLSGVNYFLPPPSFIFSLVHSPPLLVLCLSIYFRAHLSLSLLIDVHIQEFSLSPPFLPPSGSDSFLFIIKLFLNCSLLGLAHAQSIPHGPCFPGWWALGLQWSCEFSPCLWICQARVSSLPAPSQDGFRLLKKAMAISCCISQLSKFQISPAGFAVVFVQA